MLDGWQIKSIGECASNEPYSTQIGPFGKALTAAEYVSQGVPVLRGVNVNHGRFHDDDFVFITDEKADQMRKYETFPGDVLLVHKGTLGKIGLMPSNRKYKRYILGNSMLRVKCDESKLLPEFLFYWLSSPSGQNYLYSRVSQVGVPQIQQPLTTLRQASFPVPPLDEQGAITKILTTIDEKIELFEEMNQTLSFMGTAIFERWFIDFEFPDEERRPYKTSGGEMVYDKVLEKEMPKGWRVDFLSNAIAVNPIRQLSRGKLAKKVAMSDLKPWQSWIESWNYKKYQSGPKFKRGDTLLARITPSLENGKTAFVSILDEGEVGFGSTEFIVLGQKEIDSGLYIFNLCRSNEIRSAAISSMTGTSGRQRVPNDLFDHLSIAIPSNPIVQQFDELSTPIFARIANNANGVRTLSKIRDSLLPRLMSGEIRVPIQVRHTC